MKGYKTNHLLIPMGCDFGYQDAAVWFHNMESLMQMVNKMVVLTLNYYQQNSSVKYNLLYSTPSCYTYHVNKQKVKFPVKFDDFLPYGIEPGAYWTGFYTTRGGLKMHIKRAGQILQSCKQLSIFTALDDMFGHVNQLRDAMAVMQHHDIVMSLAYANIWKQNDGADTPASPPTWTFCHDLNISSCEVSEGSQQFLTALYNPLSWPINVPVRLPVNAERVTIVDGDGKNVAVQMVPVPERVTSIPERRTAPPAEAVFRANIPPMSVVSFSVKPQPGNGQAMPTLDASGDGIIQNEHLYLKFDIKTGRLASMYNKVSKMFVQMSQDFAYYVGDQTKARTSGAYLFVPQPNGAQSVTQEKVEMKVIKGEIVQEMHQKFNPWVSQVVRLYKGAKYAEFQWVVGPLDNSKTTEVISRFTSSMKSGTSFHTDSNGREMIMRIRRTSEDNPKVYDPISGNYYPVTSRIFIQDDDKDIQLTVLPDRPQGGSSLASGSLELMVHRRVTTDDDLGIGQPLVDNGVDGKGIIYTGKHYVCLDSREKSTLLVKHLALQLHLASVPMFARLVDGRYNTRAPTQHNFLNSPLPNNVQIVTLDRISENESDFFIIRLEHVFEEREDRMLSMPVEVNLESLFSPFKIVHVEESTLGGNFRPTEIHRLTWETTRGATSPMISSLDYKAAWDPPFTIKLRPMEIRTFRIQIVWQDGSHN
ncbi:unnamed protein product [Candidula unifasciata]|uniref:Glycoside hydrolase family 38 central domain-containing protein n=1 Tax=Candidula unifasciata TaxID=100452 RepID=A0A8S3ZZS6_9EUPU|nr:unnamed protein product [Candidula unifasciata]